MDELFNFFNLTVYVLENQNLDLYYILTKSNYWLKK